MKTKVRLIILSHISDAQELVGVRIKDAADHFNRRSHLNFVKYLILKYSDTSVEVDPDKEYKLFLKESEAAGRRQIHS